MQDKPFHVGSLREITDQYEAGEISYGKMVDLLNEIAIKWHNQGVISKMETTQTPIEWLENQIKSIDIGSGMKMKIDIPKEFLEKAKAMEKEHIMMAYNDGRINEGLKLNKKSIEYYNKTYGE